MKQNIILIGFMGSGKTSVGEALAGRLSYQFKDTDQLIEEKAGCTVQHIFVEQGEANFRTMETQLLLELQHSLDATVLSCGGGLPLREENVQLLRNIGKILYLEASRETIVRRLEGDTSRPLLQGEKPEQKIERMLSMREPIYERAADEKIVTDNRSLKEIVDRILEIMKIKSLDDTI